MKKITLVLAISIINSIFLAQGVAINETGNDPKPNSILDIDSDDKGVFFPRLTTVARINLGTSLVNTDNGMFVYDKDLLVFFYWDGIQWVQVGVGTGSDDQNMNGSGLTGTTLTIGIENGTNETVDFSAITVPTGAIMAFNLNTCPTGWAKANGTAGTPDLRGEFIRGLDDGRGINPGRILASNETGSIQSHQHTVNPPSTNTNTTGDHNHSIDPPSTNTNTTGSHSHSLTSLQFSSIDGVSPSDNVRAGGDNNGRYTQSVAGEGISTAGNHSHSLNIPSFNSNTTGDHLHSVDIDVFNSGNTGDTETRPRNIAFLYCIKQ